jgi:hypothetical protein
MAIYTREQLLVIEAQNVADYQRPEVFDFLLTLTDAELDELAYSAAEGIHDPSLLTGTEHGINWQTYAGEDDPEFDVDPEFDQVSYMEFREMLGANDGVSQLEEDAYEKAQTRDEWED